MTTNGRISEAFVTRSERRPRRAILLEEAADGVDDGLLFVVAEFGVDGEGEDFGGGALGFGEVAGAVAKVAESVLLVQAERVVDLAADVLAGEVGAEFVAAGGADDVLVEDVLGAWVRVREHDAVGDGFGGFGRCLHSDARREEELVVAGGEGASLLVPGGQIAEFDLEDGGLEGVETGVPADFVVIVAAGHAVGAQGAGVLVELRGARGEEAGVAESGEVFGGIEAESSGVAEGAGGSSIPGCAPGLGGVLDEGEVRVLVLQCLEGVEVRALAVEMDGQDGLDVLVAGLGER